MSAGLKADTSASNPGREAESLLLNREVQALVVSLAENERPLRALAARIDWRFRGAISRFVRTGAITGRAGELIYLPTSKRGELFHLFVVGVGKAASAQERTLEDLGVLKRIRANVESLGLKSVGLSIQDLGITAAQAKKAMEGVTLCLAP